MLKVCVKLKTQVKFYFRSVEAGDVSACHVVACHTVLLSSIVSIVENVNHDALQLSVNLVEAPGKSLGVLAHLECGSSNTTCVGSLAGCEQNAVRLEVLRSLDRGRHVSALSYSDNAVCNKGLRVVDVQLVLGSARKSDIALDGPLVGTLSCLVMVLSALASCCVLGKTCSLKIILSSSFIALTSNEQIFSLWLGVNGY